MNPSLVQSGRTVQCAHGRKRLSVKAAVGVVALSRLVQAFSDAHRDCRPSHRLEVGR